MKYSIGEDYDLYLYTSDKNIPVLEANTIAFNEDRSGSPNHNHHNSYPQSIMAGVNIVSGYFILNGTTNGGSLHEDILKWINNSTGLGNTQSPYNGPVNFKLWPFNESDNVITIFNVIPTAQSTMHKTEPGNADLKVDFLAQRTDYYSRT